MKTYMAKASDLANREWVVVDATNLVLGRLASKVARVIMGKHKPGYTPHLDTGDFVVVLNADKIRVSGRKAEVKTYHHYTGWRSGLKTVTYADMLERDPGRVVRLAVQRMLPKGILGKQLIGKLKAYKGNEHPHAAQQPRPLDLAKI